MNNFSLPTKEELDLIHAETILNILQIKNSHEPTQIIGRFGLIIGTLEILSLFLCVALEVKDHIASQHITYIKTDILNKIEEMMLLKHKNQFITSLWN